MFTALALTAALLLPGAHHDPPPKHDDTGCCFQFDNSPVNIVFCTVPGACTVRPK